MDLPRDLAEHRQNEKDASRNADELALGQGVSPSEIEAKNAFLLAHRTIVHWSRSKPLR